MALILTIPVDAAAGVSGKVYNLSDYYYSTTSENDVDTVMFDLSSIEGMWSTYIDGSFDSSSAGTLLDYTAADGTSADQLSFYYYYTGGLRKSTGMSYNYLYVGDVLAGSVLSFIVNFNFDLAYFSSPSGTIAVTWESHVKFYDADLNYISLIESYKNVSLPGGGASGTTFNFEYDITIPDDAVYMVPYQRLTLDPSSTTDVSGFHITSDCTNRFIWVDLGDIDPTTEHFEEIEGKLDDMISGTPEQNEAADDAAGILGDKNQQLGDLSDQMDQLVKPDPGDLSSGLGSYVDPDSTSKYTEVLFNVTNSNFVVTLMSIACTLVLCSYVLFGKRV